MTQTVLKNKILEAAEQKVESQLTPQNRADYMKLVVAGMRVALNNGPNSMAAVLKHSKDPIHDCVLGAVNLVGLLQKQSRGTAPLKAMVPAAMTLMLKALDFCERLGLVKIGNEELVQATKQFTDLVFQRMGVTKQMLHTAAGKVHALTQDPVALEKIKRAAGVVKAPGTSTPTELPNDDGQEQEEEQEPEEEEA